MRILCCDCKSATFPSGESNSNTTVLGPGELANKLSSCSGLLRPAAPGPAARRNSEAARSRRGSAARGFLQREPRARFFHLHANLQKQRVAGLQDILQPAQSFPETPGVPARRSCPAACRSPSARPSCERMGRVPTMSPATVISLPLRCPSTSSSESVPSSFKRAAYFSSGWPDT